MLLKAVEATNVRLLLTRHHPAKEFIKISGENPDDENRVFYG